VSIINILQAFLRDPKYAMSLAIAIILGYQLVLSATPLQNYVFFAPRADIISANREGLLSLIGYFSLLLFGIAIGRFLFFEMLDPELLNELTGKVETKERRMTHD
jgi:GWT1